MADIVMRNGEILPDRTIPLDAGATALCLGQSLFETMLVRPCGRDGLFRLDAHLERLTRSASDLAWTGCPDRETLADWVRRAARSFRNTNEGSGRLRLTVAWSRPDLAPDVLVTVVSYSPPEHPARAVVTGVRVPWTVVCGVPAPKSGSRLAYSFAERLAAQTGADEALLVDAEGRLAEGAKSNLFAALGRRLVTPSVESGILPGIARSTLIDLAAAEGVLVEERPLDRREISAGCALFLTNSLWGVRPVCELDGVTLPQAPGWARRLADLYRAEAERRTT